MCYKYLILFPNLWRFSVICFNPVSVWVCFLSRTPLACPSVVVSGTRWWRGTEKTAQTGYPWERLSKQTLEGQSRHPPKSFVHLTPSLPRCLSECCLRVLCRARLSTPATPAVTLCPATPPAATATSAGSTEEPEESEEAGVASAMQLTPTPNISTRGGLTTVALTPRPTTTTRATETCPTASPISPCTASRPTAVSRNCPWEGAVAGEKLGDESLRPSYQAIRTKGTEQGRSRLLAPVLRKWIVSNPGKRPTQ